MTYDGTLVALRPVRPDDAAAQQRWFADPEVNRRLGFRYPMGLDAVAARIATPPEGTVRFTVVRRDTGEDVGYTAIRRGGPENRDAELDVVIGERSAWGVGIGTDATRTTCRYAFDRLNLHRVHLWVFADNAAAIRAYEKVGFVHEAVARHRMFKQGRWHDSVLMGLLEGELT